MRCYICDNGLSDEEVKFNRQHNQWEPCGTCLETIKDAFAADRDEGTLLDMGDADVAEEELIAEDG